MSRVRVPRRTPHPYLEPSPPVPLDPRTLSPYPPPPAPVPLDLGYLYGLACALADDTWALQHLARTLTPGALCLLMERAFRLVDSPRD